MFDPLADHDLLRIEGFRFTLGVRREQEGFFGEWYCLACDLRGGHTLPRATRALARQGAEANLRLHHALEHRSRKAVQR